MSGGEATLTRRDIIDELRQKTGLSSREAGLVLDGLLESLATQLEKGGVVSLSSLGRFEAKLTPARPGRNPATGEEVMIPERLRPAFTLSRAVRTKLKDEAAAEPGPGACPPVGYGD